MVMEIPLTRGYVALVDDADYAAVVAAGPWHAKMCGRLVYAKHSQLDHTTLHLHAFLTGAARVDHIDGDGLNNQRSNLRAATAAQNSANAGVRVDSVSGFKGVFPSGARWRAEIRARGVRHYLGVFGDPAEGARAYDAAARDLFGEFARLNFPEERAA